MGRHAVGEPGGDALVVVESPGPGAAPALLEDGIPVVRDMERYLLAFADPADLPRLRAAGHDVRLLAEPGPDRAYWTVDLK